MKNLTTISEKFDDSEDGKTVKSNATHKTISSNSVLDSMMKNRRVYRIHHKEHESGKIEFEDSDKENDDANLCQQQVVSNREDRKVSNERKLVRNDYEFTNSI